MAELETENKKNKAKKTKKNVKKNNELEVIVKDSEAEENKNKSTFGVMEVVIIMIVTTLLGLFIGSYVTYNKYGKEEINDENEHLKEFMTIYEDINKEYYGKIDEEKLFDFAIKGMIDSLDDPYKAFIEIEDVISLDEELTGSFIGIGIEITNYDVDRITVVNVYEDSPASKSGILVGDQIVAVDGKYFNVEDMSDLIYDNKTSKVGDVKHIELIRNDETVYVDVSLDNIVVTSVYSSVIEENDKKIGVFKITNFANNTYDQFLEKYNFLKSVGIDSIIIDLRGNGGGYLSSATEVASLFLNKGAVVYKRFDGKNKEDIINENDRVIDLPVVIIVDSGTASSAEVFTSSLNENLGVDVIGEKTYGKGSIQKLQTLNSGRYIKYTVQEWLTSKGKKVEGVGILPTIEIINDYETEEDEQIIKAVEILNEK